MKLKPNKCCFGAQSITFLGHVVSAKRFHLDPKNVVIKRIPIPKLIINVRAFMGFTSYHKKIILGYIKITEPLFDLPRKTTNSCGH